MKLLHKILRVPAGLTAATTGAVIIFWAANALSSYGTYAAIKGAQAFNFGTPEQILQTLILSLKIGFAVILSDGLFVSFGLTAAIFLMIGKTAFARQNLLLGVFSCFFASLGLGLGFAFCKMAAAGEKATIYKTAPQFLQTANPDAAKASALLAQGLTANTAKAVAPVPIYVDPETQKAAQWGSAAAKAKIANIRAFAQNKAQQIAQRQTAKQQAQISANLTAVTELQKKQLDIDAGRLKHYQKAMDADAAAVDYFWQYLSIFTSIFQIASTLFLGKIAVMQGVHTDRNFLAAHNPVARIANGKAKRTFTVFNGLRKFAQANSNREKNTAVPTDAGQQVESETLSETLPEIVRKKAAHQDITDLVEKYKTRTKKALHDDANKALERHKEAKATNPDSNAAKDNMSLFVKLTAVKRELYGDEEA
jgi:hypothetical protein